MTRDFKTRVQKQELGDDRWERAITKQTVASVVLLFFSCLLIHIWDLDA